MPKRKDDNSLLTRRASLAPSSLDRAAGTVEAVLSSGAGVERRGANGPYTERLATTGGAMALHAPRLPILDSHRQGSIGDVLGYADNLRSESGEIRATLHITDTRALDLIEGGAITGVSIGYTVSQWTESEGGKVRTAAKWTLMEVSLVPVPADPAAILRGNDPMKPTVTDTAVVDRAAINTEIRTLCTTAGLPAEFANGLIDRQSSVKTARAAAFDEIVNRGVRIPTVQIGVDNADPAVIVTRMADALAHRLGRPGKLAEEAAQYRPMGLHDMARTVLTARGERVIGMPLEAMLTRAVATGDLPTLLEATGFRTLLGAYQLALSPVFQLARETTANDFRTQTRVRLGEFEKLDLVPESGEVTHGGVAETSESYKLATYAKMFGLTRQAVINDDLNAFADISTAQGRAAAETQNDQLVKLLTQGSGLGPTMSDGNRLYHSAHGNVSGSAGAIGTTTLAAGVQAMRKQLGVDNETPINVVPRTLLVPPEKELIANQGVSAFYPAAQVDINPNVGKFDVAVEPRLSASSTTRWYLFADKGIMPVLEYALLSSAPGPQMLARPGWEILGFEFRVVLDFGSGAIDWRGTYSNAGA